MNDMSPTPGTTAKKPSAKGKGKGKAAAKKQSGVSKNRRRAKTPVVGNTSAAMVRPG